MRICTHMHIQDDEGTLLATDLPDFDAPAAALISGGPNAAGGSSSSSGQAGTPMLGSTTGVMSFRLPSEMVRLCWVLLHASYYSF